MVEGSHTCFETRGPIVKFAQCRWLKMKEGIALFQGPSLTVVLVPKWMVKALQGKQKLPESMTDEEKEELLEKALTAIHLLNTDEVFRKVEEERTPAGLWLKLEQRYMTKSLANRLWLKHRLYHLRMKEDKRPLSCF